MSVEQAVFSQRDRARADSRLQPDTHTEQAGAPPLPFSLGLLHHPHADAAARVSAVLALQRTIGNRQVTRLLAQPASSPTTIQRYPVRAPRTASCDQVIAWLNRNSPYRPMWAKTTATFNWRGGITVSGSAPDFRLSISDPDVTMRGPTVDMPQWNPSDPAMQTAWQEMHGDLRTHEGEHEQIANDWHTTLRERLAALDLPVTARSEAAVRRQASRLVNAEWNAWIGEYQAAQRAIDPYTAILNCPAPAP